MSTVVTDKKKMVKASNERKIARTAGILFIVATLASLLSTPFLGSISESNYLTSVSANGNQVMTGVLLIFIGAFASASIAISMYPILRKYNQGLALGSVAFRILEGAFYIVGGLCLTVLVTLSQEFVKGGVQNLSSFQTLGVLLLTGYHSASYVAGTLAFCLGALLYYFIFYQTKLVPRWLSVWGLVGATMCLAASLMVMFDFIGAFSTAQVLLALPIAVQEMALAVWLIVKGFNPAVIPSRSDKDILVP